MTKHCFIVEDLLPLYNEELLSEESTAWLEKHVASCTHCQQLTHQSKQPLRVKTEPPAGDMQEMFHKINRKLSYFQITFMTISLVFAMTTSLLNDSFHFILTYTILGVITYLFYKQFRLVFFVTFIPIFIWFFGIATNDYINGDMIDGLGVGKFLLSTLYGGTITASIHVVFSLIGGLIGLVLLKMKNGGGHNEEANNYL